jgi:hypothetical protein
LRILLPGPPLKSAGIPSVSHHISGDSASLLTRNTSAYPLLHVSWRSLRCRGEGGIPGSASLAHQNRRLMKKAPDARTGVGRPGRSHAVCNNRSGDRSYRRGAVQAATARSPPDTRRRGARRRSC